MGIRSFVHGIIASKRGIYRCFLLPLFRIFRFPSWFQGLLPEFLPCFIKFLFDDFIRPHYLRKRLWFSLDEICSLNSRFNMIRRTGIVPRTQHGVAKLILRFGLNRDSTSSHFAFYTRQIRHFRACTPSVVTTVRPFILYDNRVAFEGFICQGNPWTLSDIRQLTR